MERAKMQKLLVPIMRNLKIALLSALVENIVKLIAEIFVKQC